MHVVLPLWVGGWLYIAGRTTALLMWDWGRTIGAEPVMTGLRQATTGVAAQLPDWVLYSLPDALWVYALTYAIVRLQRRSSRFVQLGYLMVPIAFGPGAEVMQAFGWLPGTFDLTDLVLCVGALLAGWFAAKPPGYFSTRTTGISSPQGSASMPPR